MLALALLAAAGCGNAKGPGADLAAAFDEDEGKADQVKQTKLVDHMSPGSTVYGSFDRKTRVYGYVVEAKRGARLMISLSAVAGPDAAEVPDGAPLDTILGLYGPFESIKKPGPKLAETDDAGDDPAAPPIHFDVPADGRYLVVFSSWQDTGWGRYTLTIDCAGTDFQCLRPAMEALCQPTTRYIQGGGPVGSEIWRECHVVLLEPTRVLPDAVLTIEPGVMVQGNYLGGDEWGTVNLVVEGSLQAAGTAEHPVVLTALSRGWQGLVLAGHSNTLENVYVEKAKTGITVQGSNNTFVDLNINSCDVGLSFAAGSKENRVERVAIDKVRTGILLAGAADIVDSVILGNGPNGPAGAGIQGSRSAETSRFYRALVAQFPYGLDLDATQLEVYDGTITKNGNGILVHNSQTTEGVHPAYTCPAMPRSTGPSQSAPAVPSSWGRDPVFVRCDIVGNAGYAVRVQAPELVVVEESNIRGNGRGIVVEADSVHPQSRIVRSNIHGNGEQAQVEAMHVNGSLDISQNYWAKISDPELSRSWQMSHSQSFDCRIMSYAGHCSERYSGCSPQGRDIYQCGPYPTCRDAYTSPSGCYCEGATVTATWQSPYRFTGFSPTPLPAGPERENLTQKVQEQRQQQGL